MRNTKRAAVTLVVVALAAALFGPSVAQAGRERRAQQQQEQQTVQDTVTVEARREIDVEPDIGTVNLGVRSQSRSADAATDSLTDKARSVIDALKDAGFTEEEISTFDVELRRVCLSKCRDPNPDDSKRPEPVLGYQGSAGVKVETSKIDRLGDIIDIGVRAGASSVRGVFFDVSDRSEAVKEALRQAMIYATDKARILAETGGRTLGSAIVILEGTTRAPQAFAAGDAILGEQSVRPEDEPNPFPIEPPTLSASARVEVTFRLN